VKTIFAANIYHTTIKKERRLYY